MILKELAIGSNGYYFVNGFHVDKETFEKELLNHKVDKLLECLNKK